MDGFDKLHNSIVTSAAKALEQTAPGQVRAFREALRQANVAEGMNALNDLQTGPQFNKWRDICIALIDVQLQIHRVKTSLLLLSLPAPRQVSAGEWVMYQQDAWWIWTQGLLDRFEKLTKRIVRRLTKPSNPHLEYVGAEVTQGIKNLKSYLREVRDSIAHGGGAVEAILNIQGVERYVLMGGYIDIKDWLEPMASHQGRWHQFLTGSSARIFDEIDKLSERLNREVKWDLTA